MEAEELDAIIRESLPRWFGAGEPFSAPEVFALLTDERSIDVSPEDVYAALDRLADKQAHGLRRLYGRHMPHWNQRYVQHAP